MVEQAVKAADMLAEEGINAAVFNISAIKPLDNELIIEYAKKCGAIVTSEEHSVIGGLGSAVAEAVSEAYPCPVVRHGVNDEYGKSGPAAKILEQFGLTADEIAAKAKIAIGLK